jgi:hypothetical protein
VTASRPPISVPIPYPPEVCAVCLPELMKATPKLPGVPELSVLTSSGWLLSVTKPISS